MYLIDIDNYAVILVFTSTFHRFFWVVTGHLVSSCSSEYCASVNTGQFLKAFESQILEFEEMQEGKKRERKTFASPYLRLLACAFMAF